MYVTFFDFFLKSIRRTICMPTSFYLPNHAYLICRVPKSKHLPKINMRHLKGAPMGDIIHRSEIRITRTKGPTRKALIKGFEVYRPVLYL